MNSGDPKARYCPYCGAANAAGLRACHACGAKFAKRPAGLTDLFQRVANKLRPGETAGKKCPTCGSANGSDARCCSSCGSRFRQYAERYDVFISYRRDGGSHIATLIKLLLERDYNKQVFLDVDELQVGRFDEKLLRFIEETPNFLLILTGRCLDRCTDKSDWLKREVVHALATGRNIIPVLVDGFGFPGEEILRDLPESMRVLPNLQGVSYTHNYKDSAVRKIAESFREVAALSVPPQPVRDTISPPRPAAIPASHDTPAPAALESPPIAVNIVRLPPQAAPMPPMLVQPARSHADFWGPAGPLFGLARVLEVRPEAGGSSPAPEFATGTLRCISFVQSPDVSRPRFQAASVRATLPGAAVEEGGQAGFLSASVRILGDRQGKPC